MIPSKIRSVQIHRSHCRLRLATDRRADGSFKGEVLEETPSALAVVRDR